MALSDKFVFHDNIKFNPRSYTRRCYIDGNDQSTRLTVPIRGASQNVLIKDVIIDHSTDWMSKHLKSLEHTYRKSLYFTEVFELIASLYTSLSHEDRLCEFNTSCIEAIANHLGIDSTIVRSSNYPIIQDDDTDLYHIKLIQAIGGQSYLSGIGARAYQNDRNYRQHSINIGYLESTEILTALFPESSIHLSILSVLMNTDIGKIRSALSSIKV